MSQNALSVIVRVKPDQTAALETLLDELGARVAQPPFEPFSRVKSLHFASLLLLNRDPNFPPGLVLESNHDGSQEHHVNDLAVNAADDLAAVFRHCEGFPDTGGASPNTLKRFLQSKSVRTPAFYVGCYGQSLDSIRNAMNTRQAIEDFLDARQQSKEIDGLSQREIFALIREHLKQNPVGPVYTLHGTHAAIIARSRVSTLLWILLAGALIWKFPKPVIVLLTLFLIVLRYHEIKDARSKGPTPPGIDPRLFGKEDIWTQNHLTTMVGVKPGKFRIRTLKGVLALVNALAKTVFIAGSLGGIPTIHFARWLLMDDDRRLLFFSNYDGSWASYLGDFVDKANYGLTAVWSNTDNFPPSNFLFFGGARHIEAFKLWSRQHNEYAAVWYSAYPEATVNNITNAVIIRDGLDQNLSDSHLSDWFKRL